MSTVQRMSSVGNCDYFVHLVSMKARERDIYKYRPRHTNYAQIGGTRNAAYKIKSWRQTPRKKIQNAGFEELFWTSIPPESKESWQTLLSPFLSRSIWQQCFFIYTPSSSVLRPVPNLGDKVPVFISPVTGWVDKSGHAARTLESWVRIPLKAWMSMCVFILCLYCSCVGRRLATGWSPAKEAYRLCTGLRSWKSGQGPTKGCRAIDR
jgi:hypothetical protein